MNSRIFDIQSRVTERFYYHNTEIHIVSDDLFTAHRVSVYENKFSYYLCLFWK